MPLDGTTNEPMGDGVYRTLRDARDYFSGDVGVIGPAGTVRWIKEHLFDSNGGYCLRGVLHKRQVDAKAPGQLLLYQAEAERCIMAVMTDMERRRGEEFYQLRGYAEVGAVKEHFLIPGFNNHRATTVQDVIGLLERAMAHRVAEVEAGARVLA